MGLPMTENAFSSAKISVWWDIGNCQVPKNFDANSIAQNIASALINSNFHGPISIYCYGDTTRIPFHVQYAISSTGISLKHVPADEKGACDNKSILVDMLLWAVDNHAPANYFLISGDSDFSNALHQLRMRRYNILLAQPSSTSASLVAAAGIVWRWPILIAGGAPELTEHVNNVGNLSNRNPNYSKKLIYQPKPSTTDSEKNNDNNSKKNDCSIIPNLENSKTSKLFRLAPHEFFFSNDPTIVPISTTCSSFSDSHDLHHNRPLMFPVSSGYDASILSTSVSKPISSCLTASPKVLNNHDCGGGHGQEFCNENLNQKITDSVGGSDSVGSSDPVGGFDNENLNQKITDSVGGSDSVGSSDPVGGIFDTDSDPVGGSDLLNSDLRKVKSLPILLPYEDLQGLVDVIIETLKALKHEMVFPSERNITDCIRYGDSKYLNIDVKKTLNCAIEQQRVIKRRLGALHLYVLANESLWKCVNPLGGLLSHFPEAIWIRIEQFLASSSGRSAILASRCRYEAALILKRLCLGELVLGDVLKILEIIIIIKNWIIPCHSSWQPITISLMEAKDDN